MNEHENEFNEAFEVETLQDWQGSAGQIIDEPVAGGCNSNSTNNS